jgi:hypothetical protein
MTAMVRDANAGTADAIVDWVFIELRDVGDPSVVVETRSALLQRDGDVVDPVDGISPLKYSGKNGSSYYVSVKHRNHLGVMTAYPVVLTGSGTLVDFITASADEIYDIPGVVDYNSYEMVDVGGLNALWAGNANADNKVKYLGNSNDNLTIQAEVTGDNGNVNLNHNYNNAFGYFDGDINMDGKVKYQGSLNDPTFIFMNVLFHYAPVNTLGLYDYDLFLEQLP